jgi:hypothetical protein
LTTVGCAQDQHKHWGHRGKALWPQLFLCNTLIIFNKVIAYKMGVYTK